jgi:hypothetical protein
MFWTGTAYSIPPPPLAEDAREDGEPRPFVAAAVLLLALDLLAQEVEFLVPPLRLTELQDEGEDRGSSGPDRNDEGHERHSYEAPLLFSSSTDSEPA